MRCSTSHLRIVLAACFLIVSWQGAALWVGQEILFPGPVSVLRALGNAAARPDFFPSLGASFERFLLSFGLAFLLAFVLGVLSGRFQAIYELLVPAVQLVRAVPTVAIILLVMIWLRSDRTPVMVGVLMGFPILYYNVVEGMRAVDRQLLEMARVFGLCRWRLFSKLYLPSLRHYLLAGAMSAAGVILKMVIAAEVFSQPKVGIGARLQAARIALDPPSLFAWALLVIILSVAVDGVLKLINHWFFRKL